MELIYLAWYLGTGVLFAELMRMAWTKNTHTKYNTISYFAIVGGWIAVIPPIVYKNWRTP